MNEQIRSLFPVTKNYVYLNSAAVSPPPTTAIAAVKSQLDDVLQHGSLHIPEWIAVKNRARNLLAQMLGARDEQVAFMRNTSDSLATIANGLRWEKGDNVVTFAEEFPSNFYPWRRIRDAFGVEIRSCPERNGRLELDEFLSLIDANTKVVTISAVQFASGYRADLERIGETARKFDALFVVDAIQALGTMPFDVEAQKIDALAGASHKWLCAPEGGGYIFLSDRARERIEPTLVGWISVDLPFDFIDTEQKWRNGAMAWESGTNASAIFYGLEQSLKLLSETGTDKIQMYLEELTDYLCELLQTKNYLIISSRLPKEKSQIVCIEHLGGISSSVIAKDLEERKIIVSPRGSRLRIAPHFYNTREEIKELVENLP